MAMDEEAVVATVPPIVHRIILVSLGWAAGAAVGYSIANRVLKRKYDAQLEAEIAETKAFYAKLNKADTPTPEVAVRTLLETGKFTDGIDDAVKAMQQYKGEDGPEAGQVRVANSDGTFEWKDPEPEVVVEVEETNNIFATPEEFVWDYVEERKQRSPDEPYLIHEDEYQEGKAGFNPVTLTYYAGDDTLADEKDEPIPTIDDTIGRENLLRFGHGTGDPRTMFVRNDRLEIDFEVLLHDGKFAHEVLGFQHGEMLASRDHRVSVHRFGRSDE